MNRNKRIGDNNRKGRHYYQYVVVNGKIVKTIKHRVDHTKME